MSKRFEQLNKWLSLLYGDIKIEPASEDASFKKYYRLFLNNNESLIVVDAPPRKENNLNWLNVQKDLLRIGCTVPHIVSYNLHQGYVIMSDLGRKDYLSSYTSKNYVQLINHACNALHTMQNNLSTSKEYPTYDCERIRDEVNIFRDWYVCKYCKKSFSKYKKEWQELTAYIASIFQQQPQVWIHRDYHSRNLMIQKNKANTPGIIDFQDACIGPICYDLVSLIRDCYHHCSLAEEQKAISAFYKKAVADNRVNTDYVTFCRWVDICGIQRHLKAVGIFSRLLIRDNKEGYIKDIPLTLSYICKHAKKYPHLQFLIELAQPQ